MTLISLKESVVLKIKEYFQSYREFIRSDQGKRWLDERRERSGRYRKIFSVENIDSLSESDLSAVIVELWANALWTNKQYIVDRVLKSNDFNVLKSALKNLLWGSGPLRDRFDRFFKAVKAVGPAQATEIMCMARPEEYFIWNERSRRALKMLGLATFYQ